MSSDYEGSTKSNPVQITEGKFMLNCRSSRSEHRRVIAQFLVDEAAVYDRQIRLWGLEAQQR